jgi:glycosyltransferase involved in cell wall biosynthesis
MPKMDKILCKTHDAVRIFKELYPELQNRVRHIGFESKDNYDPSVPRQRKFLHIAGQSRYKNSPAVAYAFAKCFDDWDPKDRVELTFIGAYPEDYAFAKDSKNCTYIQRASDAEMKRLQNECLFHIIPSGAEGWGHAIHEGLGVGAVVITTNFPPMNEFAGIAKELYVRPQRDIQELAARRAMVGAYEVREGIEKALKLSPARVEEIRAEARAAFLEQREYFRNTLKSIVEVA